MMSHYLQCARCKVFIPTFSTPYGIEWEGNNPRVVCAHECEADLEPGTIVIYTGPMENARLDVWEIQDVEGALYVLKCGSMTLRVAKSHVKVWENPNA